MGNKNTKSNSITYRRLSDSDISEAIRLHKKLIPSAGARMGAAYLQRLYGTLFSHPDIHLVVGAFEKNQLVGFISATKNTKTTDELLARHRLFLVPTLLFGLIRNRYSLGELLSHAQISSNIKQLSDASTAYILSIAVDPAVQRQGIATRLIGYVHTQWKTKTILVDTQKSNVAAQKFYKKLGFIPVVSVADSIIFRWVSA